MARDMSTMLLEAMWARVGTRMLEQRIKRVESHRRLMRSSWIVKKSMRSWRLWSRRDDLPKSSQVFRVLEVFRQNRSKVFISLLRMLNELHDINMLMINTFGIRMDDKRRARGKEWATFRRRQRLGILELTPPARAASPMMTRMKAQVPHTSTPKHASKAHNEHQYLQDV